MYCQQVYDARVHEGQAEKKIGQAQVDYERCMMMMMM